MLEGHGCVWEHSCALVGDLRKTNHILFAHVLQFPVKKHDRWDERDQER